MKRIKKSIAVFAACLLMSSGLNAYNYACFDAADNLATAYANQYGWSYEQEYASFVTLYETCVAAQQQ